MNKGVGCYLILNNQDCEVFVERLHSMSTNFRRVCALSF